MADEETSERIPDDVQKATTAIMQRKSAAPDLPPRPEAAPLGSDRTAVDERVAKKDPASGEAPEVADDSEAEPDAEEEDQGDGSDEEQDPNEPSPDDIGEEEEEAPDEQPVDDDSEHEVMVDGEKVKVKLSDLKNNYSGEKAIEKRLQQATELRNGSYQFGQALYKGLQMQADKLKQLDTVLQQVADPQIDWEKLRMTDTNKYLLERDKQRDAIEKRKAIEAEQTRVKQQQDELIAQERIAKADDEARILTQKLPVLRDPQKGKAIMTEMINTGTETYGFHPKEITDVIDHRMLLVLHDAVKYRKLVAKKNAKVAKMTKTPAKTAPSSGAVKTLLRPGGNPTFSKKMAVAKQAKANVDQARKTGQPEDVAKLLIQPAKRR